MSTPSHAERLRKILQQRLKDTKIGTFEKLEAELPRRWERFDNVALLPLHSFSSELWTEIISDTGGLTSLKPLKSNGFFERERSKVNGERVLLSYCMEMESMWNVSNMAFDSSIELLNACSLKEI